MTEFEEKKLAKKIKTTINTVKTLLIICSDDITPIQCWYHFDRAEVKIVPG